jgi:hypothetical protein
MQRLPNVHPSNTVLYPNGIGIFAVGAANEGSKILLYNATQLSLQLDFLNGSSDTLHPWEANYWILDGDTKQIQWSIDVDSLSVTTPPMSAIFLTLYNANENVPGTFPVSLPYQTSLGGGNTNTNVTSTNSIVNDGNPAGTSIIESTVTGKASTTILTNDGLLNLMTLIAGTLTQLIKTQNAGNPLLLGAASTITEILGNETIDGNLIINGTVTIGGGASVSAGDLALNTHNITSGNNISVSSVTTTGLGNFATLQSGGYLQNAGDINVNGHKLLTTSQISFTNGGTLSGISAFSGSGSGTYNHGFGSSPAFCVPVVDAAGSATMGYSAVTSTQVTITMGASLAFKCYCYT